MPNVKNQETVKSLTEKFKTMRGLILTEYRGLTVEEISDLRSKLRSFDSEYTVVKNTLSEIAFKEIGIEISENFSGPTALVIESGDIISPAKVVMEFAKAHTKLKVKAGFLEGKFVSAATIEQLSVLPSKEVLIAKMLGGMKATVTGFVNVLSANIRGLVTVLDAAAKKQAA
ncbi:50S ribosomal protein L10 [Candidatus Endomicrobiellum agilis]|uniref:50S ribosomal protein L10 n=1 Tax=Candidatus Endomicrobiellum agilis TaxID=3238957 RepID=UPI00358A4F96|nr:50S ribosomal protein L10 [Endomicrobium sp.]